MSNLRITEATARLMDTLAAANARAEQAEAACAELHESIRIALMEGGNDVVTVRESLEKARINCPTGQSLLDRLEKAESERAELVVRQGASDAGFSAARTGQPNDPPLDMGNEEDWSLGWCAGNWRAMEAGRDRLAGERAKAQAAAAELTDNFRSFAMNLLPPEQVEPAVQLLLRCQKSAGQEILAELARLREARAVPHCLYARLGQCGMPEGLGSDDQATWLEQYLRQRQDDCANVKAENARLREALKPFAARWRKLVHDYGEKHFEGRNETEVMVNVNHLKAAAAALSPAPPIGKIDIHLDAVSGKGIPQTGDER